MERNKTANYDRLGQFLQSYLQENRSYKAGTLYAAYVETHPEDKVTQKDFAMFLRYQVEKDDGMLKRTAHGIYEMRNDPSDRGITFPRKGRFDQAGQNIDIPYMDSIYVSSEDAALDKIYDDTINLMARMRFAVKSLQGYANPCPELQMELESYLAGMLKNMSRVADDVSGMMAWCEDHWDQITLARDVQDTDLAEDTLTMNM